MADPDTPRIDDPSTIAPLAPAARARYDPRPRTAAPRPGARPGTRGCRIRRDDQVHVRDPSAVPDPLCPAGGRRSRRRIGASSRCSTPTRSRSTSSPCVPWPVADGIRCARHSSLPRQVTRANHRGRPARPGRSRSAWDDDRPRRSHRADRLGPSLRIGIAGQPDAAVQDSVWDGLAIRLAPFSGTPDRWIDLLTLIVDGVHDEDAPKIPRFMSAIEGERAYFDSHPVSAGRNQSALGLFYRLDDLIKQQSD